MRVSNVGLDDTADVSTDQHGKINSNRALLSVDEYRRLLGDLETPSEIIERRINFLTAHCRSIARLELQKICQKE